MDDLSQYEICYKNIKKIVEEYTKSEKNRNEATIRFQLIDEILVKCLGWEKSNIITEEAHNGEYTDYTLRISSRPIAILEAKKEGIYFELAVGTNKNIYSLKTLCKDNPEFKKAIIQAAGYCQERGIKFNKLCQLIKKYFSTEKPSSKKGLLGG